MTILIYFISILLGVLSASGIIYSSQKIVGSVYPMPDGMTPATPMPAFLLILLSYAIAAFFGGLVATFFSGRYRVFPAIVTGAILTIGGIYDAVSIYQPLVFTCLSLVIYIPFAYLGYWIIRRQEVMYMP
ncbi:MAG: hypothetical protein H0X33_09560 [Taibaiella sp.]|nr:hypothetical protein [Taibaiella sp.]